MPQDLDGRVAFTATELLETQQQLVVTQRWDGAGIQHDVPPLQKTTRLDGVGGTP
jgi:hypothetical protein